MSNELKQLVKEIQFKTDKSLGEIAKEIGYSRAYFNTEINKGENEGLLKLLKERYMSETEQIVRHGVIKGRTVISKHTAKAEDWVPFIRESTDTLIEQIEARRKDFEKWADMARADKERAEKEKDRLLTIIEDNLSKLLEVSLALSSNLNEVKTDTSFGLAYQRAWVLHYAEMEGKGNEKRKQELVLQMNKFLEQQLPAEMKGRRKAGAHK